MKLVDLLDSKSCGRKPVSVRVRPEPPTSLLKLVQTLSSKYTLIILTLLSLGFTTHALELKTTYQDGVPLKFNLDDPQSQGLCGEILQLVKAEIPELSFVYTGHPTSLARVESDFKNNQIDLYPCLIYTERRKKFLNYSKYDLFTTQHLVIGRKENIRYLKSYDQLKEKSLAQPVLVLHGSTLLKILQEKNINVDDKSSSVEGILKMLVSGRAEYYYEQNLNLGRVLESPQYKGLLAASYTPWMSNSLRFAYSKKLDKKTVTKIENALKVLIESGRIKALQNKYNNLK